MIYYKQQKSCINNSIDNYLLILMEMKMGSLHY